MLADTCISNVLKMVVDHASWDAKALRIESVIWDMVSRADMLMLRFLTKICSSDPESLVARAVRLSMGHVTDEMCNAWETRWNRKDCVHKQSWAQQVLAPAWRLGVPLGEVRSMSARILLAIQEELTVGGAKIWVNVQSPTTYVPER